MYFFKLIKFFYYISGKVMSVTKTILTKNPLKNKKEIFYLNAFSNSGSKVGSGGLFDCR